MMEFPLLTEPHDLKEGDVVTLKSGGPEMTVERLERFRGECRFLCIWFVEGHQLSATFKPAALAKA